MKDIKMTYNDLIEHFGNEAKASAELGFSITTIKRYKDNEIARTSQYAIQALTKGKLKAYENLK
jgi:hypothetical protein